MISNLAKDAISVELPRFTLRNRFDLNRPLSALGMGAALTAGADFSGLCRSGPCRISQVRQKSYLSVDEHGTTAAAVTSVGQILAQTEPIVVDRPFLLAIRDTKTGAILFLGAINDPASS